MRLCMGSPFVGSGAEMYTGKLYSNELRCRLPSMQRSMVHVISARCGSCECTAARNMLKTCVGSCDCSFGVEDFAKNITYNNVNHVNYVACEQSFRLDVLNRQNFGIDEVLLFEMCRL